MTRERQANIDVIRGSAMILVMIGHGLYLFLTHNDMNEDIGWGLYNAIYTFHMPWFFAISGYVAALSSKKESPLDKAIIKDIITLYIPYLFMNYFYLLERYAATAMGFDLQYDTRTGLMEILALLYSGDALTWFLLSLLLIELIWEICVRFLPKWATTLIYSSFFLLSYFDIGGTVVMYIAWGLFYWIGYLISDFKLDKISDTYTGKNFFKHFPVFLVAASFLILIAGIILYLNIGLNFMIKLLIGISSFYIILFLTARCKKIPVLTFSGRDCIVIYAIHGFTQSVFYQLLRPFIVSKALLLIVMIACQIFVAYLVCLLMNKVRFLSWVRFFFYPYSIVHKES